MRKAGSEFFAWLATVFGVGFIVGVVFIIQRILEIRGGK
jgi:hypothetical protein